MTNIHYSRYISSLPCNVKKCHFHELITPFFTTKSSYLTTRIRLFPYLLKSNYQKFSIFFIQKLYIATIHCMNNYASSVNRLQLSIICAGKWCCKMTGAEYRNQTSNWTSNIKNHPFHIVMHNTYHHVSSSNS